MTDNHPITPPPELLQQWATEYWGNPGELIGNGEKYIAIQAARWGADQEMDACLEWFSNFYRLETWRKKDLERFRAARRPKPPSLKEQALKALTKIEDNAATYLDSSVIRRALEQLDD